MLAASRQPSVAVRMAVQAVRVAMCLAVLSTVRATLALADLGARFLRIRHGNPMQAAIPDARTRHHRVTKGLHLRRRPLQQYRLEAMVVVEVHVQGRHGEVVVCVVRLGERYATQFSDYGSECRCRRHTATMPYPPGVFSQRSREGMR